MLLLIQLKINSIFKSIFIDVFKENKTILDTIQQNITENL